MDAVAHPIGGGSVSGVLVLAVGLLVASPRLRARGSRRRRSLTVRGWGERVERVGGWLQAELVRLAPSCRRYSPNAVAVGSLALVVAVMVAPPVGVVGLGAALGFPVVQARRQHQRARQERERQLPEMLDQLGLAVASGLPLLRAIDVAVRWCPDAYRPLVSAALDRCRNGVPLVDALRGLAESIEPVGRRPMAVLIAAVQDGTPLASSLTQAADEARLHRQRTVEARARRLPVLMLFPLVMCVLPAFVLLTIVPLLLASLGDLGVAEF